MADSAKVDDGRRQSWAHRWWPSVGLLVVIFAALFLSKREVWFAPPYWDSAMGLYFEADFLAETHFDYPRLFRDEPRFLRGGPAVYLTSLLSTLLAGLMTILDDPDWVHFWYRSFHIACGAGVVYLVFEQTRQKVPLALAVLIPLAMITTPVWSAQLELLGMEMPLVLAAMVAVVLSAQGRVSLAAAVGLLAFLIKANGMLVIMALLTHRILVVGASWTSPRQRRWDAVLVIFPCLVAFGIERGVTRWLQSLAPFESMQRPAGWTEGLSQLIRASWWCPDVAGVIALTLIFFCFWFVSRWQTPAVPIMRRLSLVLDADPLLWLPMILLGGILVSHLMTFMIPRYWVYPVSFAYLALGRLLADQRKLWPTAGVLLSALVAINIYNQHGSLYPSVDQLSLSDRRTGAFLERSLEYRLDHDRVQAAVRKITSLPQERWVIAPAPLVHFLSLPRLGYVDQPRQGLSMNAVTTRTFSSLAHFRDSIPADAVLVSVRTRFTDQATCAVPAFRESDELIATDREQFPASPLIVFAIPEQPATNHEVENRLWPWRASVREASRLAQAGEFDRALAMLTENRPDYPKSAEIDYRIGEVLEQAGRWKEAAERYASVASVPVWHALALERQAGIFQSAGNSARAQQCREEADRSRWLFREPPPDSPR